ncbi:protein kinase family protein [Pelomyxa schiedti]|nr:protein kinase family protein [Pelomyxa schiedti]
MGDDACAVQQTTIPRGYVIVRGLSDTRHTVAQIKKALAPSGRVVKVKLCRPLLVKFRTWTEAKAAWRTNRLCRVKVKLCRPLLVKFRTWTEAKAAVARKTFSCETTNSNGVPVTRVLTVHLGSSGSEKDVNESGGDDGESDGSTSDELADESMSDEESSDGDDVDSAAAPAAPWYFTGTELPPSVNLRESDVQYNITDRLGSGVSGDVYKGKYLGAPAAVKVVNRKVISKAIFLSEVYRHMETRHINVLHFLGAFATPRAAVIVFPYKIADKLKIEMPGGELSRLRRLSLSRDLARGMYYLDTVLNIVHRDLKPGNLLIDNDWRLKIADFGSSEVCLPGKDSIRSSAPLGGTTVYMPPEVIKNNSAASKKSDMYVVFTDMLIFGNTAGIMVIGHVKHATHNKKEGLAKWEMTRVRCNRQRYHVVTSLYAA